MKLLINNRDFDVDDGDLSRPLLWVLRDELGLTGTKYGCGKGICGSCTIHLDDQAIRSCVVPLSFAEGKAITTIEGLAEKFTPEPDLLHPVQQAFVDYQVPQCGWCMPGQIMTAAAFLDKNPQPSEDEIIDAMSNNYCRCGTYVRIKAAVDHAAKQMVTGVNNG